MDFIPRRGVRDFCRKTCRYPARVSCLIMSSCIVVAVLQTCIYIFTNQKPQNPEEADGEKKSVSLLTYSKLELPKLFNGVINCTAIIQGNETELQKAKQYKNASFIPDHSVFIKMTKNCTYFLQMRKYITFPLIEEDEDFPIAYSIVIHQRIDMFERLLRSIYMAQHIYCIHVDSKSDSSFKAAVQAITSCFPNVFIATRLEAVTYASWSRVQADLNCMEELLRRHLTWKYFINLCGMDLPIVTDHELIEQLKALKGRNNMETTKATTLKEKRWKFKFVVKGGKIFKTNITKDPIPILSSPFVGSAYIIVSRKFVEFIFTDQNAKSIIKWAQDTYSPDELIWASLQRLSEAPGFIPINHMYDVTDVNAKVRLVKWSYLEGNVHNGRLYPPCTGIHRRAICIYGAGDLHWILHQQHLFANKFDTKVDPVAVYCLEAHLRHKTMYEH
ncbi:beta-1,3-galactosyl-O-glycosyl-glycoprotein beta-1,6-N-acetylglucosaminyltransferase-like isoform X2 [Protopterus annectens]|uniref:beta-1,3-galactosyl-O-glycosyl-glycoprotein beta-1,6-N-acetylglucosaminyltransferase-like isoform X2 n=1 Tax=Protopterus annectens TaxID=7888 RepID=UPI001CFBD846|nr:beta-1,3-galactosyl-O-glycosyl-glycoprotein beta-1,6-N-acetylglucosaminyltransferase-like isoform X2 [Protopterus annectens]